MASHNDLLVINLTDNPATTRTPTTNVAARFRLRGVSYVNVNFPTSQLLVVAERGDRGRFPHTETTFDFSGRAIVVPLTATDGYWEPSRPIMLEDTARMEPHMTLDVTNQAGARATFDGLTLYFETCM